MGYEIPQQLEYKEKIIFGLTFKQLAYVMLFAPIALIVYFKTSWYLFFRVFITMNLTALAVGFIFLNLDYHLKIWYKWFITRKIEKPEKVKKFVPVKEIKDNLIYTNDKRKIAVLKITPINFSIKPENAKEAITAMFQKFLNSLDFPVQILMNTEKLELKEYFKSLNERIKDNKRFEDLYKKYKEHLEGITKNHDVIASFAFSGLIEKLIGGIFRTAIFLLSLV